MVDEGSGQTSQFKLLTTARQPAHAVIETLRLAGIPLQRTSFFSHGTTVAINALIERKGAITAIVATEGFKDTLELRRGSRTHLMDPLMDKPYCFVPGRLRTEVPERIAADGSVLQALDESAFVAELRRLVDRGVESVAICFLHSYAYPAHEQRAGELAMNEFPSLYVTLSSDIVGEIKEYERTSTAALNAYCRPVVDRYLKELEASLQKEGLDVGLFLMQSNGGLIRAAEAALRPINILESGPAAGSMAAVNVAKQVGEENVITFDMGGTTAKASVIEDLRPLSTVEYELFELPGKPNSGWPVRVPMINIVEVGAGGGSVAHLDEGGRLQLGPQSAGSEPGPACYGRGGKEPTITDAYVTLGFIESLLGGTFSLDASKAREAIQRVVAGPLGLSIEEAAAGILRIAGARVVDLIREVTIAQGRDPRDFSLVAYGGAGPLEAGHIAAELGLKQAVIPPGAGTFSAFGLLDTDLLADAARTYVTPLLDADLERATATYAEMDARLVELLLRQGVRRSDITIEHTADIRYRGQFHLLSVDVMSGPITRKNLDAARDAFARDHLRLYRYADEEAVVELVNLRARVVGFVPRVIRSFSSGADEATAAVSRKVYPRDGGPAAMWSVYQRELLPIGMTVAGPAVLEEMGSTTIVPSGTEAKVDKFGNLILRRRDDRID